MLGRRLCANCAPTIGPGLRRWEAALDSFTADRIITDAEEFQLRQLSQQLGLTDADLSALQDKLHRARCLSSAIQGRPIAINAALNLKRDESCFFASPATLYEERTTRRYVSGSRGVSIRIAKGVSYRVGSSRGYYVPVSHVVAVCDGTFSITNKRCIFSGARKTVTVELEDLLSFDSFDDGIQLHHPRSKGLQVFKFSDGEYAAAVLSGLLNPVAAPSNALPFAQPIGAQPSVRSSATPWYKRPPLSLVVSLLVVATMVFIAPLGVAIAWLLRLWSWPVRAAASLAAIAFFIYVVTTMPSSKENTKTASASPSPAPANVTQPMPPEPVAAPRADEADWMVKHCKPDKDSTKIEGGQAIRHLVYRKRDVELMYSRDQAGSPWVLVGRFKASKDESLTREAATRRLPCADGHLSKVNEQ